MADNIDNNITNPAADDTVTAGSGGNVSNVTPDAAASGKEGSPDTGGSLLSGAKEAQKDQTPPAPDANGAKSAEEAQDKKAVRGDDADDAKDAEGQQASPDVWEPFKLPEGLEYDEEAAAKFGAFAKEQGLTQEAAQKFVDFYCSAVQGRIAKEREDFSRWADEQEKAMKDDAEFGGPNFEANLRTARIGLEKLAPKELLEYVNHNWLGSFKPFVLMCWKAGKLVSEGTVPDAHGVRGGTMTEDELAELMFGKQK